MFLRVVDRVSVARGGRPRGGGGGWPAWARPPGPAAREGRGGAAAAGSPFPAGVDGSGPELAGALCPGRRWHPERLAACECVCECECECVCVCVCVCVRARVGAGVACIVARLFPGGFGAWRERGERRFPAAALGSRGGPGKRDGCLSEVSGRRWTRLLCCSGRTQRRGGERGQTLRTDAEATSEAGRE